MTTKIDVLVIDDDKFIQKLITKTLTTEMMEVRTADDGESGIEEAIKKCPDIILLDVEMPGINGYEVCDRLRNKESSKQVPIIFLSSHSSLRERMQGYEVGADDYLVKPFEKDNLVARINVLVKYHIERKELHEQYQLAHKNAVAAMTGSSELAIAMRFLEKSLSFHSINELAQGLFECTDQLSLECCAMIFANENTSMWYSSENTAISPLEKELIEMCDKEARFLDFGNRTIINYPCISLLIKNMPLDDLERYGRVKDLLPIILSAVNSKTNTVRTEEALTKQSENLLTSFKLIQNSLFYLGTTIVKNRKQSTFIMNQLVQGLNIDFLGMGLEEDQEAFLLTRIDSAIDKALDEMDAGKEIREALTFVRSNLNDVADNQKELYQAFKDSLATEVAEQSSDLDDSVELF
ncbi:MAG: response regulator [Methylococcaceae bacterium]|nr:response regulator [Methylococcaceae bacterium]